MRFSFRKYYCKLFVAYILMLSVKSLAWAYNDSHSGPLTSADFLAIRQNCPSGDTEDWVVKCAPSPAKGDSTPSEVEDAHMGRMAYFMQIDKTIADKERDAILANKPSAEALHAVARYEFAIAELFGEAAGRKLGVDYLTQAERLAPENVDIIATRAWVLESEGKYKDAIELYQKILDKAPANTLANKQLGGIYFAAGSYEAALERFSAAAANLPLGDDVRCQRAETFEKLEQIKNAHDDYQKCVSGFPGNFSTQIAFAKTQSQIGDFEGSIKTYDYLIESPQMAIVQSRHGAQLYMRRGIAYLGLGKTEKAAADFEASVKTGEKRTILQMQLFLRKNGVQTPINGTTDQTFIGAVRSCLLLDLCKLKLAGGI
jgi:tetratricopeptide (TPR) repeat protein